MLSDLVDNIEDYLKSNTEEKSNEYTVYPKMNSSERKATQNINNYIGTFCPQGHYYLKKNGMIEIQKDTVPITSSTNLNKNLSNFNTEINIETFSNVSNDINFKKEQIVIIALFIVILLHRLIFKMKQNFK